MPKKISQLDELVDLTGEEDVIVAASGQNYRFKLKAIRHINPQPTKESLGLDKVENTADKDKQISDATQQAIDGKADKVHGHNINGISGLTEVLDSLSTVAFSNPEW
jgi:hypothetical protein